MKLKKIELYKELFVLKDNLEKKIKRIKCRGYDSK